MGLMCCLNSFFWGLVQTLASGAFWLCAIYGFLMIVLGQERLAALRHRYFAFFMFVFQKTTFVAHCITLKEKLFVPLKKQGKQRILEIGVGTGTNLKYYPEGSKLTLVDPNPHFEAYFQESASKNGNHLDQDMKFVVAAGESMPQVEDNSVDSVVLTLVLCSVLDMDKVLAEVRRVLVPGGAMYFIEHVGTKKGTGSRMLQDVLTSTGVWPLLADGCILNRDIEAQIRAAGFSKVECETSIVNVDGPGSTVFNSILNPLIYGRAIK